MKKTCFMQISREAYNILVRDGVLYCDKKHYGTGVVKDSHDRKYFLPAYNWMLKKMIQYGIRRPSNNHYPLWCWVQMQDIPNGGHLPININLCKDDILVKFEIDESDILMSDFDLFHIVLNKWYIGKNYEEFMDRHDSPYKRRAIRKSWDNCLVGKAATGYIDSRGDFTSYDTTQGVFFELRLNDVISTMEI